MTELRVAQRLDCPAEVAWAMIGDFGGLHRWHPRVRSLELSWEGRIRTLHYRDGGHAVERLDARNDAARRYAYVLVDGSLPVLACRSTLQVGDELEGACEVAWNSVFEAVAGGVEPAERALRELYRSGLRALAEAVRRA